MAKYRQTDHNITLDRQHRHVSLLSTDLLRELLATPSVQRLLTPIAAVRRVSLPSENINIFYRNANIIITVSFTHSIFSQPQSCTYFYGMLRERMIEYIFTKEKPNISSECNHICRPETSEDIPVSDTRHLILYCLVQSSLTISPIS